MVTLRDSRFTSIRSIYNLFSYYDLKDASNKICVSHFCSYPGRDVIQTCWLVYVFRFEVFTYLLFVISCFFFFLGAFYSSPSLPYVKWILCLQQHALQNSKMSVHVEKVDSCSLWIQIEVFDASVISLM